MKNSRAGIGKADSKIIPPGQIQDKFLTRSFKGFAHLKSLLMQCLLIGSGNTADFGMKRQHIFIYPHRGSLITIEQHKTPLCLFVFDNT
jgi:hypothetical protein